MSLPIKQVKNLPRKNKRQVWLNWWKHRRDDIPGETMAEKKANWRALWQELRAVN